MKKHVLLSVLLLFCALTAQSIEVKTPYWTAELSPQGAMLTALSSKGKSWMCVLGKIGSFTDRLAQNLGPLTQGFADTAKLDFMLKNYTVSKKEAKVTFSAPVGLIPDLRMEKSFIFSAVSPSFTVEYIFTNEDDGLS